MAEEMVLVFPTKLLDAHKFQGVLTKRAMQDVVMEVLWENKSLSFMDRATAENDPTFKQIIPYCIFKDQQGNVFSYERTSKGGETRLHGYRSCGVGGHLNPVDSNGVANDRAYITGVAREIEEETGLKPGDYSDRIIGVINDDSNPVGKVHFGICAEILLFDGSKEKMKLEGALASGKWSTIEQLKEEILSFENWSQLLLRSL